MSGLEYLDSKERAGKRSFRTGLSGREKLLLNKELHDVGQVTVAQVRLKKEQELRNVSPEREELNRKFKEEFSSHRHVVPVRNPSHIADNLRSIPERVGSRERAGLPSYNPLDKDLSLTPGGPLRKYPFIKKYKLVPLEYMKNDPKMTSVGVLPLRNSTQMDGLSVVMEGSSVIPIDDRTIHEIQTANAAARILLDDQLQEPIEPINTTRSETQPAMQTIQYKPAILGQCGTIRQAPYIERPTRPSSRGSQHGGKPVSGRGKPSDRLTESKLNIHDGMSSFDPDKIPDDNRSEGSTSTVRSVKELLEEAEAITRPAQVSKKRKTKAKLDAPKRKKKDGSEAVLASPGARGTRSVDEIIASLKTQNKDEGLSESDRKIQEIMNRVLQRTQAVLGATEEDEENGEDKMAEEDTESSCCVKDDEDDVTDISEHRPTTVTFAKTSVIGSETGASHQTDGYVSSKMKEVEEALAAIRSELEAEKRLRSAEQKDEVEEAERTRNYQQAVNALKLPSDVTYEDLISIKGREQILEQRRDQPTKIDHLPKPTVQSDSVSFLSTCAPRPMETDPDHDQAARSGLRLDSKGDKRSIHYFCCVSDEYQLPHPFHGLMKMYHAPDKYSPGEFSLQRRFGLRTARSFPSTTMEPASPATFYSNQGRNDRLSRAAQRVMDQAMMMEPSDNDVTEWRKRSDMAFQADGMEIQGEKMALLEDDSRFYWTPAPAKLDLAPRYVKEKLFPQYHGTLKIDYQAEFAAVDDADWSDEDMIDARHSGIDAGHSGIDAGLSGTDPIDSIRRHRLQKQKCKSSEDLTIYARAKHKRSKTTPTASEPGPSPSPLDPFTSSTSSPHGMISSLRGTTPRADSALMESGSKKPAVAIRPRQRKTYPDPSLVPTFVRRRTTSAPSTFDDGDSLQITDDFKSDMDELNKQQASLKAVWKSRDNEDVVKPKPEISRKKYENLTGEKMLNKQHASLKAIRESRDDDDVVKPEPEISQKTDKNLTGENMLNKQHASLKAIRESRDDDDVVKPEPEISQKTDENLTGENMIDAIMSEVPENLREQYQLTLSQKIQIRDQKKTPSELALEAGRGYVILPIKKKKRKSVDPARLKEMDELFTRPANKLERSDSYRRLNVPLPDRSLRVPQHVRGVNRRGSLPDLLHFDGLVDKRQGPSDVGDDYRQWARDIWNSWFDEIYPPESEGDEEVAPPPVEDTTKTDDVDDDDVAMKKVIDEATIELVDDIFPVFDEDEEDRDVIIKLLTEEVSVLSMLIDSTTSPNPFHICRRGAIYKKLGKLCLAMKDLDRCLDMEPLLMDAYWHRHLLYLMQNKKKAALEDLNFLLKHNKQHAKAYKSRAEIYRQLGEVTLSIANCSFAIKLNPEDDESYFRRAEMYEARGDKLLALEDFSKVNKLQPHRTDALHKHALFHFTNKNWQPAISDFTEILKQDPSNAQARTLRGRAFAELKQYNASVQDFSAAVHLDPFNHVAFYQRACLLRKSHPQRALKDFSLSLLIDDSEDNIQAYLHRGILYYELDCIEDAIADFEAVIALNKDNACAHCNLGLIYYHSNNYHRAVKKFTKAVFVNPTYLRAYLCRADAYVKLHDLKNALYDITRAIFLQPNIPHYYMYRGYLLLQQGQLDLAAYCIRNAAGMNFDSSLNQSATQQAIVQAFLKNYDKVLEILRFATKQTPTAEMQVLLGKMLMKAEEYEEAIECFDAALVEMRPSHIRFPWPKSAAEVNYLKGMSYGELGQFSLATEALNQALSINGRMADAYYQRGLMRMKQKHMKGVQDFNRALAINPNMFQAYLSRAAYYGMKEQYSKAVLNCNEAIRLQSNSVRAYLYRGSLKYHLRAYELAIQDLSTAILIDNQCHLAYFNRAICYHDNKQYLKALTDYGIVLLLGDFMKVKVLINRGLLYYDFRDYGNALQDFLVASQLAPEDHKLYHSLGLCYHRLNHLEESVKCYTKALELSPFFLDAYIGRGNAYMDFITELGLSYSRKDYQHCMLLNPGYLPARVNLAYNLQMKGKFMQAWMQFSAALAMNPEYVAALEGRSIISLQMSNTFGAIQDISAALKVAPSAELYTNRGVMNQMRDDKVNAMRDYKKALVMDPGFSLAYFNSANIYFHSRQFTQALDFYNKALIYDLKDESAFLNRAITKVMLEDPDGALNDFQAAINLTPGAAHIYYNRANLYTSLYQYPQAEEDYSKVLEIQPGDLAVYRCRADVRGKMGDKVGAVADYIHTVNATY